MGKQFYHINMPKKISMTNKQTPPTLCTLYKLPPEIRAMIFNLEVLCYDDAHWERPTPALLAALRCEETLYREALSVYYNINEFHLSGWNYEKFDKEISM